MASVQPQIPQDVAAALARDPMRRLDTTSLSIYYPAPRRDEALRFADRTERCARALRARTLLHNDIADQRMAIILPDLTFNNALTSPIGGGYAPWAVVPTLQTIDAFSLEFGLPPDPATIACHELTHYVHLQEVAGFSYVIDMLFGDAYTPQIGFDAWFDEGLAVYYETLLQPGVGRLAWPFWNGAFRAGVAGHFLRQGELSEFNRDAFVGNHYLIGSAFIRYLAERYGEWPLWKLIEIQARSIFFPLGIDLRFRGAVRKDAVRRCSRSSPRTWPAGRPPSRGRPSSACWPSWEPTPATDASPDGSEAWITEGHDTPPRLVVRGPDGRTRLDRLLIDVLPPRRLVVASAESCGSPSFTADGRTRLLHVAGSGPDLSGQPARARRRRDRRAGRRAGRSARRRRLHQPRRADVRVLLRRRRPPRPGVAGRRDPPGAGAGRRASGGLRLDAALLGGRRADRRRGVRERPPLDPGLRRGDRARAGHPGRRPPGPRRVVRGRRPRRLPGRRRAGPRVSGAARRSGNGRRPAGDARALPGVRAADGGRSRPVPESRGVELDAGRTARDRPDGDARDAGPPPTRRLAAAAAGRSGGHRTRRALQTPPIACSGRSCRGWRPPRSGAARSWARWCWRAATACSSTAGRWTACCSSTAVSRGTGSGPRTRTGSSRPGRSSRTGARCGTRTPDRRRRL